MAKIEKLKKEDLPEGYDPYDVDLKKQIHPLADQKNFVSVRHKSPMLCCGGKKTKKKGGGFCKAYAGQGTDHPGYGRCKFCGGNNKGPITEEGKRRSAANSRKHGFYSQALSKSERDTYEELLEKKSVSLEDEIFMLKAKILNYLREKNLFLKGAGSPEVVYYKEGETAAFYRAGTIEDKPLTRALETLRRLVDSYAKIIGTDTDSMMDQVNAELRTASQQQAQASWGGQAQQRKERTT
jgi:hypothetical protein